MYRFNFLGAIVRAIASNAWWQAREDTAKTKLQELDEGRRCVSCDGTNLERYRGKARCLQCGHVISLSALRAAVVSENEISDVTRPPDDDT